MKRWTGPASASGVALLLSAAAAMAQSSSLFVDGEQLAAAQTASSRPSGNAPLAVSDGANPATDPIQNEPLNQASFIAVAPPPPRTFRVHDLVTIIVLERTRYRSDNQNQQDRRFDFQWELEQWFRIVDHNWTQQPFSTGIPAIETNLNDRRVGNGRSNRQDELTTRITAEVVDIRPNGQLVLQATRTIQYDEEEQVVTLIGTCRSGDVTPANSVLSTQLSGLELRTQNVGQIRDANKRGWLLKLIDFARPL